MRGKRGRGDGDSPRFAAGGRFYEAEDSTRMQCGGKEGEAKAKDRVLPRAEYSTRITPLKKNVRRKTGVEGNLYGRRKMSETVLRKA